MAKLAVIVPVYNVEPYIKDCINSLIQQTMHDIDIICVDDCGTDKSIKIVEQFAQQDKRIKIVHNDKNSGLSESRNNGVRACNAEYIMFCDSDDFFAPDMCEKMYNAITAGGADIAICGTEVIYEADHDQKKLDDGYFAIRHSGVVEKTNDIVRQYSVCTWNKIYHRDIIEAHNVWFPTGLKYEDEYFWRAYMIWVNKIAFVPEKLYKYRRRAGSIMSNTFSQKQKLNTDNLKIAFAFWDYLKTQNILNENAEMFWDYTFYKMVNGCLNKNAQENWPRVFDMACEFIDKNCEVNSLPFYIQCEINNIKRRIPQITMYLGGLMRRRATPFKTEFCVFKMPVWKIKPSPDRQKYYLVGIRVW